MKNLLIATLFIAFCFSMPSYANYLPASLQEKLATKDYQVTLTRSEYDAWAKSTHQFIYKHTVICNNYDDAVTIYNRILRYGSGQVVPYSAIRDICRATHELRPLTVKKIFPNKKIALVWVNGNDTGNPNTFKLWQLYVFVANVHDRSEIENKLIK